MEKQRILDQRGKPRVQTINNEPSRTVQSDAHLADIKNILTNFGAAAMDLLDEADLVFGDVSDFGDYHDVMLNVRKAEVEFLKLPSKVREIFDHSVEKWLDTANDKEKRDELVEAGFIERLEVVEEGSSGGDPTASGETSKAGEEEKASDGSE